MAAPSNKRRRIEYDTPHEPVCGYAPTFVNAHVRAARQNTVHPNDIWQTISSLDDATLRETLFHATVGNMTHSQMVFQVLDLRHTRIRAQHEAAEAARKREEARLKRTKTRTVDFDHHFRIIEAGLQDPCNDRRKVPVVTALLEKRIYPRIAKILEKATARGTNLATKMNALETLRKIAEAICANSGEPIGLEIAEMFVNDDRIEAAMLAILQTMQQDERRTVRLKDFERTAPARRMSWWREIPLLMHVGRDTHIDQSLFQRLDEVLLALGVETTELRGNCQNGVVDAP